MEKTITLFNTGGTPIQYRKDAKFLPGTSIAFPESEAVKLKRLFADDLKTADEFASKYVPADGEEKRRGKPGRKPRAIEETQESQESQLEEQPV